MIIDFHTHTFPDPIADAAIDRLSRQANITAYTCGTAAGLLLAERAAPTTPKTGRFTAVWCSARFLA